MKTHSSRKTNEARDCCGQQHGKKSAFIGVLLIIFGIALGKYGMPAAFVLAGGVLIIRSVLVMSEKK